MISIIITTYKREPLMVSRAISSALKQTYRGIELIVVDDSPSDYALRDDVKSMVQEYCENYEGVTIRYIAHDRNRGACAARNTGINCARGEFVAFLDDDDEWMPEKLCKQLKVIEQSNTALVYCGYICKNDSTGNSAVGRTEYYRGHVFDKLIFENFIGSTSFPLIRLDCIKAVGGFDELMQSAQDCDVWLRIAEKYTIDYVDEPLVIYHEHNGEQITTNPYKRSNGLERLNQKYKKYIEQNRKLWYRRHIIITPYYAMAGNVKKAYQVWFQCVGKYPENIIDHIRYLRGIFKASKRKTHE